MSAPTLDQVREAATVTLTNNLQPKTFKSGKEGFYAQGKITIEGRRYQSQIMLVEIAQK